MLLGNKRASKAEQRRKADMPQSACAPKRICHKAHALPKRMCYKGNALQSGCTRLVANWTVRDKRLLLTIDGRKTRQGRLVGLAGEEQIGRETICEATTHLLRGAMGLDKSGQEGRLSEADKPSGWPSFLLPVFSFRSLISSCPSVASSSEDTAGIYWVSASRPRMQYTVMAILMC